MTGNNDFFGILKEPGTFSRVTTMTLKQILKEGTILRKKSRFKGEYAISFHLAQEGGENKFIEEGTFGIRKYLKSGETAIAFNKNFTKFIRGKISKGLIVDLFKKTGSEYVPLILPRMEWSHYRNEDIEKLLKQEGITTEFKTTFVMDRNKRSIELRTREMHVKEYLYTLAALENLVTPTTGLGVRAYFVDKKGRIQPIKRIPAGFIQAIAKEDYTPKDMKLVKKWDKIEFFKYDSETGETVLLN